MMGEFQFYFKKWGSFKQKWKVAKTPISVKCWVRGSREDVVTFRATLVK